MRVMSYNILGGGRQGDEAIIQTIRNTDPDYLVLNEANTYHPEHNGYLKHVANNTNLKSFSLALSGESSFHVAVMSKTPFKQITFLAPLKRAGILTLFDADIGEVAVVGTHLTPLGEDMRVVELRIILDAIAYYEKAIIIGDLNSLSPQDDYPDEFVRGFNLVQKEKFTKDDRLQFGVAETLANSGFADAAVLTNRNHINTTPTKITHDIAHANMRLDYVYISSALVPYVADYMVIKNNLTDTASDHYPIAADLRRP